MPSVRTVVCFLIAGVLAVAVAGIAGPALAAPVARAAPAAAEQGQHQQSTQTVGAVAHGLAVSIDSVSPQFASTNSTVVVTGTITNHTGAPIDGVQVDLYTWGSPFTNRTQMGDFSNGEVWHLSPVVGNPWPAPSTLHSHATMSWSASFSVASQGYLRSYEVYPIEAAALSDGGTVLGKARTFLPYWPGSGGAAPNKLDVAWIWPLIDKPQQGACSQDLATNDLASSLAAGGRLNGLLAAGLKYARSTRLTWAVDPALLSDAKVMTQRYKVGGNEVCTDTTAMPSSNAARTWLNDLRTGTTGTTGTPMFVTPYADPDVSALVHSGLDTDLARSYALGDSKAQRVLDKPFGSGALVAWPPDGAADASVLSSLARYGGVKTTVLNSGEMPALQTGAPDDAVTSVPNGIGTTMGVLLADSGITTELGSATAASSASAQFSVEQDFLAQTAMIVAEAPYSQNPRSVVIAPPQRWDPSEGEAAALLRLTLTTSAPWLRPVSLSSLASAAGKDVGATGRQQLRSIEVAPEELGAGYMGTVKSVGASASLYESMLYEPSTQTIESLEAAIAVTESSAWRGRASKGGRLAIAHLSSYFGHREKQVLIISKNKVVLGGTSGATPVSVFNGLDATVQVQVRARPAGSQLSIGDFNPLVILLPQQTKTVRLPVHSAALGSALIQLQLVTKNGTPLGSTQSLSIESTRFGRALLIVIAAALGVLVLASLARWVRRWWRDGTSGADGRSEGAG
jgi:hypothetical protein